MAVTVFSSNSIGQKLASATGNFIKGLAVSQPPATAEVDVPLTLADMATFPVNPGAAATPPVILYSGTLLNFFNIYAMKPGWPTPSPPTGYNPPVWPMGVGAGMSIRFFNGVFVLGCPKGVSFSLTTEALP